MTEPEKINWDLYNTREEITDKVFEEMKSQYIKLQKELIEKSIGIEPPLSGYEMASIGFNFEFTEMCKVHLSRNGYPSENLVLLAQVCLMMLIEGLILSKEQGTKTPVFPKSEYDGKDISSTDISSN